MPLVPEVASPSLSAPSSEKKARSKERRDGESTSKREQVGARAYKLLVGKEIECVNWEKNREREREGGRKGGVRCLVFIHVCMIGSSRAISPDGE